MSRVDDEVVGQAAVTRLPEGTVLEAISHDVACVAYRIATSLWTVTGHGNVVTSEELMRFAFSWRIVRVGQAGVL